MTRFLSDHEIYEEVVLGLVPKTRSRLWIATADIKDMYVEAAPSKASFPPSKRSGMVPFLRILSGLLRRNVEVRLIHAKEPGAAFREDFDKFPRLWTDLERVLCPRVHFKCVIVDGETAYFGSANLTGAGMGAKSPLRRNFENGILTDDPSLLEPLSVQFDDVWRGARCGKCGRRQFCTDCPV